MKPEYLNHGNKEGQAAPATYYFGSTRGTRCTVGSPIVSAPAPSSKTRSYQYDAARVLACARRRRDLHSLLAVSQSVTRYRYASRPRLYGADHAQIWCYPENRKYIHNALLYVARRGLSHCGSWDIIADMTDTCSSWYSATIAGRSSIDDIYAEHFPLSDKLSPKDLPHPRCAAAHCSLARNPKNLKSLCSATYIRCKTKPVGPLGYPHCRLYIGPRVKGRHIIHVHDTIAILWV